MYHMRTNFSRGVIFTGDQNLAVQFIKIICNQSFCFICIVKNFEGLIFMHVDDNLQKLHPLKYIHIQYRVWWQVLIVTTNMLDL